jgi:hypothetical protein
LLGEVASARIKTQFVDFGNTKNVRIEQLLRLARGSVFVGHEKIGTTGNCVGHQTFFITKEQRYKGTKVQRS